MNKYLLFYCFSFNIRVSKVLNGVIVMKEDNFGDFIYNYRTKHKFTFQNLHEITGVSQPYLSQLENGTKNPSRKVVDRIAKGIANNDNIEISQIHNTLLRLAGYSEIKYTDSLFEAFGNKSTLNGFNQSKEGLTAHSNYDFPINDLYFHLTDSLNKKMFKTVTLSDYDTEYITKMIEVYLLHKLENQDEDFKESIEALKKDDMFAE